MAEARALDPLARWEPMGLPVGSVAIGLGVAGLGDVVVGVVQGFAPQVTGYKLGNINVGSAAIKGAGAWIVGRYAGGLLGRNAAAMGALFLTASAVAELFDIRTSISNIVGGVVGKVVTKSPGVATGPGGLKTTTGVGNTISGANPGV